MLRQKTKNLRPFWKEFAEIVSQPAFQKQSQNDIFRQLGRLKYARFFFPCLNLPHVQNTEKRAKSSAKLRG